MIRAVKSIIDTGHANGIWVGMCGELAGNPLATVMLLGLGLDEFSMVPSVIPEVKKIIRSTTFEDARTVAANVLRLPLATDVRAYLDTHMRAHYPHLRETLRNGVNSENGTHRNHEDNGDQHATL